MRTALTLICLILGGLLLAPATAHAQVSSDSTYTVQAGDTLYSIAQRFGVSVEALQGWNDLEGTGLQQGQTLRVRPPRQPTPAESTRDAKPASERARPTVDSTTVPVYGRHTVNTGDTFVNLSLRLGTTADTLFALNDSTSSPLPSGRTLRLPSRFAPPTHTVQSGETLYTIAGQYGVSVRALRAVNNLDSTLISPGQRLQMPPQMAPSVPSKGEWAGPDSLGSVAIYPETFAGRLTASGAAYDPDAFVASHPSLPYGSVVLLSRPDRDRHAFARIIDRGPLDKGVLLDVSAAVADKLGIEADATPTVALRTVWIGQRAE